MKLKTVTLSGADESVSASDLAKLSEAYPFVEWGVLISPSREGREPRYPSARWRELLINKARESAMGLSGHLCGAAAQSPDPLLFAHYERLQLNGVAPAEVLAFADAAEAAAATGFFGEPRLRIIGQARDVETLRSFRESGVVTLFDVSGGTGQRPLFWPESAKQMLAGYAGGIGLDNLTAVLTELTGRADDDGDFWIDMESSLREDAGRVFSLEKAEQVLATAKPFVELGYTALEKLDEERISFVENALRDHAARSLDRLFDAYAPLLEVHGPEDTVQLLLRSAATLRLIDLDNSNRPFDEMDFVQKARAAFRTELEIATKKKLLNRTRR